MTQFPQRICLLCSHYAQCFCMPIMLILIIRTPLATDLLCNVSLPSSLSFHLGLASFYQLQWAPFHWLRMMLQIWMRYTYMTDFVLGLAGRSVSFIVYSNGNSFYAYVRLTYVGSTYNICIIIQPGSSCTDSGALWSYWTKSSLLLS